MTTKGKRNTLHEVRWERGGRVWWRYQSPSGKVLRWHQNTDTKPANEDTVRAAFATHHVDTATATFLEGVYHTCPRCGGTGFYGGGSCFRCYGNSSRGWTLNN